MMLANERSSKKVQILKWLGWYSSKINIHTPQQVTGGLFLLQDYVRFDGTNIGNVTGGLFLLQDYVRFDGTNMVLVHVDQ